ncbi:MAG: relaxase/mobilization nuclease domain-containing protein, partial [Desulfovibrio sp.]|nr:relaxase/mobilization nuclease domain-containing protein [Desulfovibrio sp.]
MIVKKMKRTVINKPKAAMISGLVDYILAAKDDQGREKLVYSGSCNFITTTAAGQKAEMIALAQESVQSKMPVTHWMLSWDENEIPDNAQVDEAVALFLERMELKDHQAMYALHGNTENYHVHILVNRVHPYTEKVIQPHHGFDLEAAHRTIAEIEFRQGWHTHRNARYYVAGNGKMYRRAREIFSPKTKAADMERATGEKSLQRIARDRGEYIMQNAASWRELHEGLAAVGLRYEKKGSGAVIGLGEEYVKASSVNRALTLARLEDRLGSFEQGRYPPPEQREPKPLNHFAYAEEWQEYRKEKEDAAEDNYYERLENKIRERRLLERQGHEQQDFDRRITQYGKAVQRILKRFLKMRFAKEYAELRASLPKLEKINTVKFKDWLREKRRKYDADLWRKYENITFMLPLEEHEFPEQADLPDHILLRLYEIAKLQCPGANPDVSRIAARTLFYLRCLGKTQEEAIEAVNADGWRCGLDKEKQPSMLRRLCDSVYGAHGDIVASYIGCRFLREFCTSLPNCARCIPLHSLYGAALYPEEIPEDVPILEEPESLPVTPPTPDDTATEVKPVPAQHEGFSRRITFSWLTNYYDSDNMASPPTEEEEERPQDIVDPQERRSQAAPHPTPEWRRWEDENYADSPWAVAWPVDYELTDISPKYPPGVVISEIPKPKP